ncbi:MAG: hypothetical protein ABL956_19090 [Hyphomonadaceae bacterium]
MALARGADVKAAEGGGGSLANRIARIVWTLMISGEAYTPARGRPAQAIPA